MYLQGTNLEVADYDGRTALHIAASEGHTELVKFFLSVAQVHHNPRDRWSKTYRTHSQKTRICNEPRWGRTPLDDARQFNRLQCVHLLENHRSEQKRHRSCEIDENDEGSDSETTMFVKFTAFFML